MKKKFEKVLEIYRNPRGRGFLFFGFYLFFFMILFFVIHFGGRNYTKSDDYETGRMQTYHFEFTDTNYVYGYSIHLDDLNYEYIGERDGKLELLEFQNKKYFRNNNQFFIQDGLWIKSESPFVYQDFLDTDKINLIMSHAMYESKTTYESGKINYNYLISSNTLNQILYGVDSDYLEEPNRVVISIGEDKKVHEIHFYLDSYCLLNNLCTKSLKIDLEYDGFGKIEKIENPIA